MREILTYSTLLDIFTRGKDLDKKGIRFIEKKDVEKFITYRELYQNALRILYHLQARGVKPGQEVVFQIDDNQDFVETFWACLLGGIIPAPVAIGNNDEHKLKLIKIWKVLHNPHLITSANILEKLEGFTTNLDNPELLQQMKNHTILLQDLCTDEGQGVIHDVKSDDIAFLQFSSGSTGNPKGVTLTHKNLLTNINGIIEGLGATPEDEYLSWMPLTHDMGIIGYHLTPTFVTTTQNLLPTDRILVNLEGHGREEIIPGVDLTRTIGWFTCAYPVALRQGADVSQTIKSIKENLRQVPENGMVYGMGRYLQPAGEENAHLDKLKPEISFNYLGQFDGIVGGNDSANRLLSQCTEDFGSSIHPENQHAYLLDFNGMVTDGKLEMRISYNPHYIAPDCAIRIGQTYQRELLSIIEHCPESS